MSSRMVCFCLTFLFLWCFRFGAHEHRKPLKFSHRMDRLLWRGPHQSSRILPLFDQGVRNSLREKLVSLFFAYQKHWWWQLKYFWNFHPYLGKIPILTNIFQRGWFNHQLENIGGFSQGFPWKCCASHPIVPRAERQGVLEEKCDCFIMEI